MDDISEEERLKIEELSKIEERILSHALTVRISEIDGHAEGNFNTATGVLVRVGGRLLAITAWHVAERFVRIRERGAFPVLVLGNLCIREPRRVFRDETRDLVVLEVPLVSELRKIDAIPYEPTREWPPVQVLRADPVMILGFPALFRSVEEEILHGHLTFYGSVETVSEYQFGVQADATKAVDAGPIPFPEPNADLGGMSGAPAFKVRSADIQLVGIFCQSLSSAPVWIIRSLAHLPSNLHDLPSVAL